MPFKYRHCLSVAGSDPSGGAGIQADLKTFSALGCYGQAAITALTVQNSTGVQLSVPVDATLVGQQIHAVCADRVPDAVKIGMTVDAGIIHAIAEELQLFRPKFVVLDPVMISSSGHQLLDDTAIETLLRELAPLCTLITPNLSEAGRLAGGETPATEADIIAAAERIHQDTHGAAVLIKGGHREGLPTDVFFSENGVQKIPGHRVYTPNTHGTGCTLSSAIAAYATAGSDLLQACAQAKEYLTHALQAGNNVATGKGHGAMNHFFGPKALTIEEIE